ncbi:MAG TPA: hypothetical protein VIL05_13525 [Thermoclostridium sp.]
MASKCVALRRQNHPNHPLIIRKNREAGEFTASPSRQRCEVQAGACDSERG